jgi:PAS domain S-box-containing protein
MGDKARLQREILVVIAVIASLFLLGALGFTGLSGLRAYVGGEGLYAKAQQEATYQLIQYVHSGEESRYQVFEENLSIPLGDRQARLELESPRPRQDVMEKGFLQGGNRPDDIPAMIYLFRLFKDVHPVDKAVTQWAIADSLILELIDLGEEIHLQMQAGPLDPATKNSYLTRIDLLKAQQHLAVTTFSRNMSFAARRASIIMIVAMLGLSLLAAAICILMLNRTAVLVKRLGASEARFRRLAENAPDVIYRMALPSGQYEYMSPAAESVLGHPPEEFYARPMLIKEILHPDWHEYFAAEWAKLNQGECSPTYEYPILHKDGEVRWVNQRNVLIKDEEGRVIAIEGMVTEITERKNWESEKDRMSEELRVAHKMEAIGTLAGGIAHDFNNILSSILGNAELAKMEVREDSGAAHHLDEVLAASFRARDLIRQILSISRGELQGQQAVDIQEAVEEAINLLRASLPSNIAITTSYDAESGAVLSDPTQIHQVVMNLCTNAAHAMDEEGGVLDVSLDPVKGREVEDRLTNADPEEQFVRLTVGDTGQGIAPGVQDRIFDPYFTTKPLGKGSGMGLAVVKGIVDNNGGTLLAENKPEGGARFTVFFPRVEPGARPEPVPTETGVTGNARILFVDDEPALARMNHNPDYS